MAKKYQYNKKPSITRFERLTEKTNSCWLWRGFRDKNGYGRFRAEDSKYWAAHRWSYYYHKGEIPTGKSVCHKCDTPSCVNPDHLWIGSSLSNHLDAVTKGRIENRVFKLGEIQVKEILFLLELKASSRFLAKLYGIRRETILKVKDRDAWGSYFKGDLTIDYQALHTKVVNFNYKQSP